MRRYQIFHETVYQYSAPVTLGPHKLLVRPKENHDIRILNSSLVMTPQALVKWHRDEFDNSVAIARFDHVDTDHFTVTSEVTVEHYDEWPLDFLVEDHAVDYPFAYDQAEHLALFPYMQCNLKDEQPAFEQWMTQFNKVQDIETYTLLSEISSRITASHEYRIREEPGVQSAEKTLNLSSGSCRDFAWLFMCTARRLGLAARFVSGYLYAPATAFDYGATHAWAEIFLPGAGWKGFDPTIGQLSSSQHIPTAVSIDPEAIPPVSGTFTGAQNIISTMSVRVQVVSV